MSSQRVWQIKMMLLFWSFVLAGVVLPFLPFKIPSICLFEKIFGIPCLGCGVRSSIAAFLRGDFQQAIHYNPVGPLVLLVCVGLAGYFTCAAFLRKSLPWKEEIHIFRWINTVVFSLLSLQWGYRLFVN